MSTQLAYNGSFPGPTIQVNSGGNASITLTNGLSEDTTIHWHGMIVPHLADGHPQQAVATGGNASHPVHVHGAYFQDQSRSGGRNTVFLWEQGWKDTVLLQDGETVEVLIKFDVIPPPPEGELYLMHCHKLEHEDGGMMLNFKVE